MNETDDIRKMRRVGAKETKREKVFKERSSQKYSMQQDS